MLKSLMMVNLILEDNQDCFIMQDVSSYEMKTIKQDLEKYSNVMYLLKDLFKLLYVGYDFDEYCQNDYYFIREYGPSSSYLITEDLYLVLKQLEKLLGDDHE